MGDDERKMTISFKVLSAYYTGSIDKDSVASLAKSKKIKWTAPEIEEKMTKMNEVLAGDDFFSFWKSWGKSLRELTQEALAINFLVSMLKDWERKECPEKGDKLYSHFIRNARELLDRSIYIYINSTWKGGSDGKLKDNLEWIDTSLSLWEPVPNNEWEKIVKEIIDNGSINGQIYSNDDNVDSRIIPLIYYANALFQKSGPNPTVYKGGIEIDHIIPKSSINDSSDDFAKLNRSNLFNLETLPKKENSWKRDKSLDDILRDAEGWKIQQIEENAYFKRDRFPAFSKPDQMMDLQKERGDILKNIFSTMRLKNLAPP